MTPVYFTRGKRGDPGYKPRASVLRLPESWDAVTLDGVVYRIRRRGRCRFAVRVRRA